MRLGPGGCQQLLQEYRTTEARLAFLIGRSTGEGRGEETREAERYGLVA